MIDRFKGSEGDVTEDRHPLCEAPVYMTEKDYQVLIKLVNRYGHAVVCADLARTIAWELETY